jgi:hypothetical protein
LDPSYAPERANRLIGTGTQASDRAIKRRQVFPNRPLDDRWIDTEVLMCQQIAHPGDVRPWNRGILPADVFAQALHRLADHQQVVDDGIRYKW